MSDEDKRVERFRANAPAISLDMLDAYDELEAEYERLCQERVSPEQGSLCQRCDRRFKVDLNLPNELWTEIRRGYTILCPICIGKLVEQRDKFDALHVTSTESTKISNQDVCVWHLSVRKRNGSSVTRVYRRECGGAAVISTATLPKSCRSCGRPIRIKGGSDE
jgi:hypothetical protein